MKKMELICGQFTTPSGEVKWGVLEKVDGVQKALHLATDTVNGKDVGALRKALMKRK